MRSKNRVYYFTIFFILLIITLFIGCSNSTSDSGKNLADDSNFTTDQDEAVSGDKAPEKDNSTDAKDNNSPQTEDSDSETDEDRVSEKVSYKVVETGQKSCFNGEGAEITCVDSKEPFFGQDAQYLGAKTEYVDNSDGTITDKVTGLMWQKDPGSKMTLDEATKGADSFNLAGYSDWRLPSIKELYSLILFTGLDPSGVQGDDTSSLVPFIDDSYFNFSYGNPDDGERIIDSQFASSTKYVSTTMNGDETVFGVNFADGRIKGYPVTMRDAGKLFFVLYVRGDSDYGKNEFEKMGDNRVLDRATNLTWMKNDNENGLLWEDALKYCEELTLDEISEWRLPDVKELQTIVDYTRSPDTTNSAAIDPIFSTTKIKNEAGEDDYPFFWSSTTHENHMNGKNASYVSFGRAMGKMNGTWMDVHGAGAQRSDPKTGDPSSYPDGHGPQGDAIRIYNYVRCVTGGDAKFTTDTNEPDNSGSEEADPEQPDAPGPEGPASCENDNDCSADGACPDDAAMGCSCETTPMNEKQCLPKCTKDSDCPTSAPIELMCGDHGFCIPA